jgi:hypothetical protein
MAVLVENTVVFVEIIHDMQDERDVYINLSSASVEKSPAPSFACSSPSSRSSSTCSSVRVAKYSSSVRNPYSNQRKRPPAVYWVKE